MNEQIDYERIKSECADAINNSLVSKLTEEDIRKQCNNAILGSSVSVVTDESIQTDVRQIIKEQNVSTFNACIGFGFNNTDWFSDDIYNLVSKGIGQIHVVTTESEIINSETCSKLVRCNLESCENGKIWLYTTKYDSCITISCSYNSNNGGNIFLCAKNTQFYNIYKSPCLNSNGCSFTQSFVFPMGVQLCIIRTNGDNNRTLKSLENNNSDDINISCYPVMNARK